MNFDAEIVVVGAGLAGLACALHLESHGFGVRLLEASDAPGGRVRTDVVDGFRLERGFQVLLTAHPEARRLLDYARLDLRAFYPGALVRLNGGFDRIVDPWRRPWAALTTLTSGVGSLRDKLTIADLRRDVLAGPLDELLRRPEQTTLARLRAAGFSVKLIDSFFRPVFGGILLDPDLRASSRLFDFVFRMLVEGDVALPAEGMGAIPAQLAGRLQHGTLCTGTRVVAARPGRVELASGQALSVRAVVVATAGPESARLTGAHPAPSSRSVTCLYFVAERAPVMGPIMVVDGERRGPVNNLCVLSQVTPNCAPRENALVAVTVLLPPTSDDVELEGAVRAHLRTWFGDAVRRWRHLRTYRIAHAQPAQVSSAFERPVRLAHGLYVCGDPRDGATIHGALCSGRSAAEALLADLTGRRA